MSAIDLTQYPTLLRLAKAPDRLRYWMDVLAAGQASGQIRNVDYQDAKTGVSRAVEQAWNEVRGPHFHNGHWKQLPREVQELDYTLSVYGLHHVLAAYKRLTRSKLDHVAVREMRAFVVEVHPLAEAVAALKTSIVKGRAPSAGPSKPVNPNKRVRTCPCCFRPIAVQRGRMAHHGYERPSLGWQTASCPGVRFKPLEVSSEGLEWLVATLQERLAASQSAWKQRAQLKSITVHRRTGLEKITLDMPQWGFEFQIWCARTESEIRSLQSSLKRCNKMLAEWRPMESA